MNFKILFFFLVLVNLAYSYGIKECRIPWSLSTQVAVKFETKTQRPEGNCFVWGDKGKTTCHMPSDKGNSLSFLKQRNKFDGQFMTAQKETGISWKLFKAFVYQETGLSNKGLALRSGDGRGQGHMQLSYKEINQEIVWLKKHSPYRGVANTITYNSALQNPTHHLVLGMSWFMHKITNYKKSENVKKMMNYAYTQRNTPNGWYPTSPIDIEAFKIGASAYNGLSKGCVINNRMIVRYGELVLGYYNYLDKGVSNLPVPYSGGGDDIKNIPIPVPTNANDTVEAEEKKSDQNYNKAVYTNDAYKHSNPFKPWLP
ncbi:MAG: hypothetical protein M0R46_09975 [Candidatus Muirbacterium halophilum]|nr:hypothetical protein [Candidatus Muirbacterium halophilum]